MLTPDKIISIFGIIDEILIGIKHPEDRRRNVSRADKSQQKSINQFLHLPFLIKTKVSHFIGH